MKNTIAPRLLAPAALLLGAAFLFTCNAISDLARTGGRIASDATGNEEYGKLGDSLARSITSYEDLLPSEEHYIGRAVGAEVLTDPRYPLVDDEAVAAYVNNVGLSLSLAADEVRQTYEGYRFIVVRSPELNAFSAPGGFVFVTTGILQQTRSEDQLAAVLAHEIAHVTLKHGLQAIDQSHFVDLGQSLAKLAGEQDDKVEKTLAKASATLDASADEVFLTLVSGGYGADKERAADELGARILAAAGYAPSALRRFLENMPETSDGGWLATHPPARERAADVRGVNSMLGPVPASAREQRADRYQGFMDRLADA